MTEVLFNQNACGSLKCAPHSGPSHGSDGVTAVFLRGKDGAAPTEEELRRAQQQAEERLRRERENAVPLSVKSRDIYCFDLALSVGDISESDFCPKRRAVLAQLLSVRPEVDAPCQADKLAERAQANLAALLDRCRAGEPVRIWYSHSPDELCGFYWLLARLHRLEGCGAIYTVRLPEWMDRDGQSLVTCTSWGDVSPGEWGRYAPAAKQASPALLSFCAQNWARLQSENAPLRASLNGQLHSVPADFYDSFIRREIDTQPDTFNEAAVIGRVLGQYQLGIGDAWIAGRIEQMIAAGELTVVRQAPHDEPSYRRTLQKCAR